MLHKIVLLFMLAVSASAVAQSHNPYVNATIFLDDGEVLVGEVDSSFARNTSFRVYNGDDYQSILRSKVDSVHCNGSRYFVSREQMKIQILKVIDEGRVNLYEVNGSILGVKRDDTVLHLVMFNKYVETYYTFCGDSLDVIVGKMTRETFVEKVKEYNDDYEVKPHNANYDWLKSYAKPVTVRLSLVSPSFGLEFKISNSVSFYSEAGINMFGDAFRKAKTFLNFDANVELRYFFLSKYRLRKGKSNYNFTGSYFGASFNYFMDNDEDNWPVVGFVYGWQESMLLNNTYQRLKAGVGVDVNTGSVTPLLAVSTGWYF